VRERRRLDPPGQTARHERRRDRDRPGRAKIARLRLEDSTRITTHVLDTAGGRPAAGAAVV
jgi:hypothetical protein